GRERQVPVLPYLPIDGSGSHQRRLVLFVLHVHRDDAAQAACLSDAGRKQQGKGEQSRQQYPSHRLTSLLSLPPALVDLRHRLDVRWWGLKGEAPPPQHFNRYGRSQDG